MKRPQTNNGGHFNILVTSLKICYLRAKQDVCWLSISQPVVEASFLHASYTSASLIAALIPLHCQVYSLTSISQCPFCRN